MSTQQLTTKGFFDQESVKAKFNELLGKKSQGFITSVLQIVSSNNLLQKADPTSIYHAAATAATLDLPINQNLGYAYIVPYGGKAQFQIGWKGFVQLAQRSGLFKRLAATPIYAGQIVSENPLIGFEFDFTKPKTGIPVGYAAYFRLNNGFESTLYMTSEEVKQHGMKYSKTFNNGIWKTDFDAMATKTVIKLLLSKFAPLSIEMQKAVIVDQGVINNENATDITYIDNEEDQVNKEAERLQSMINDCKTIDEYLSLKDTVEQFNDETTTAIYKQKGSEF